MPIISFNVSNASAQRVLAAFDRLWPQDAPHDAASAKQKIWNVISSIVKQQEQEAAKQALAEPQEVPIDDGV